MIDHGTDIARGDHPLRATLVGAAASLQPQIQLDPAAADKVERRVSRPRTISMEFMDVRLSLVNSESYIVDIAYIHELLS